MLENLRKLLKEARKAGNKIHMKLLQCIIAEADLLVARNGKVNEQEIENIVLKFIKNNNETIAIISRPYIEENQYMESLIPKFLTKDEIKAALANADVLGKNAGQATGIAVKYLKDLGLKAQGKDVSEAIKEIYGQAK